MCTDSSTGANTTCPVNPCENGGTCQFEVGSYICLCPLELTGSLCESMNCIITTSTNYAINMFHSQPSIIMV